MQIDSYCRTAGLVIAGYYHASEAVAEMKYVSIIHYLIFSRMKCIKKIYFSALTLLAKKFVRKLQNIFPMHV